MSTKTLEGKVVIITGAARGIGRATAVALAKHGAIIIGIDIAGPISPTLEVIPSSLDDLEQTGKLVVEAGGQWSHIQADQRNLEDLKNAAEFVNATYEKLIFYLQMLAYKPLNPF